MCKNGDRVRIAPGEPAIVEQVPSGRLYKDGKILEDQNARAVVARRRLAFAGGAFVALALTEQGELADDPQVDLVGVPERNAVGELMDELIYDVAVATFDNLPRAKRRDSDAVGEAVRRAVRSAIAENWGKKTVCVVHVLEV
jgi:ribonuclease J